MTESCIFCDIANGKTDTQFLYEDDRMVVFKDIRPHAPVHLLIVPRRHIRSINDIDVDQDGLLIGQMMDVARQMAAHQGVGQSGYKLLFNVERGGGQVIFHLHLHVLGGWEKK